MNARLFATFVTVLFFTLGGNAPVCAQDLIHHAVKGDTLWDLCLKYTNKRGCWIELGKYNKIVNDRSIPPGSEVRIPLSWLREIPVVGQVESVQGEVFYVGRPGATQSALTPGQQLLLGSRIVTRDGTARVTLGNHSALLLRPGSELELNSLSTGVTPGQSAELLLEQGDVEVTVEPRSRFEVRTPSAIAAVRGTRYRVGLPDGNSASTRSEVLNGSVEVQAGSSLLVPAGFGVLAQKDQPLGETVKLLPPPVFEQAVVNAPVPVSIAWASDPKAVAWQLDVLAAGAAADVLVSHRLSEPAFELADLREACYQVVVRAVDAAGFNGLESRLPVCIISRLPAPVNISVDGPGDARTPYRVAWAPLDGAGQYRLEVATDPAFEDIISSQEVTKSEALVAVGTQQQFYVRVTAIDHSGNSGLPSQAVEHDNRNYLLPMLLSALFLTLALL